MTCAVTPKRKYAVNTRIGFCAMQGFLGDTPLCERVKEVLWYKEKMSVRIDERLVEVTIMFEMFGLISGQEVKLACLRLGYCKYIPDSPHF
jgi:hypothetical protein